MSIETNKKNRDDRLDFLKGVLIILVVTGHCIQYGSGQEYLDKALYFDNIVFRIIYSFHMPLFMAITGYLFQNSADKYKTSELIKGRILGLLVPAFMWAVSYTLLLEILKVVLWNESLSLTRFMQHVLLQMVTGVWYLTISFACCMTALIQRKFFRSFGFLFVVLFFILALFTPDDNGLSLYKFMYLFFFAGQWVFLNKNRIKDLTQKRVFLFSGLVVYVFLIIFYGRNGYIYTTGISVLGETGVDIVLQVIIDIYRYAIGFCGCICVCLTVNVLCPVIKKTMRPFVETMCRLGTDTLGIYVLSGYILVQIVTRITDDCRINPFLCLLEVVSVTAVSWLLTVAMKRIRILNRLFLGGRT